MTMPVPLPMLVTWRGWLRNCFVRFLLIPQVFCIFYNREGKNSTFGTLSVFANSVFCQVESVYTSQRCKRYIFELMVYQAFLTLNIVVFLLGFLLILLVILMMSAVVAVLVDLITSTVTMLHTRNQCLDSKAWAPTWVRHQALHMRESKDNADFFTAHAHALTMLSLYDLHKVNC